MALIPDTGIPRDATFDPDAAYDYGESASAGLLPPPGPMETAPVRQQAEPNVVGINSEGMWWVNGKEFHRDDHQSAVESQEALDGPDQPIPQGYRVVSPDEYKGYLKQIIDPSFGRLAKKNFGIGVDVSQMLGGSALKFFGAEETGQAVIDQQEEDLRYNQPYQRTATDIDSAEGAADWFVANAAQMAPLMAEMIITSAVTGGLGGVAATGARGAGFLASRATRLATKQAGPTIRAVEAKLAKRTLNAIRGGGTPTAEGLAALRSAGRTLGAKAGAIAAAEGVAIGDIYQTIEESGNYDSPALARLVTAVASPFYAGAEVLPAFAALKVAGKALRSGGRGGRALKGLGQGIGIEGTAETAQDMISMGAAGTLDLNDPDVINQLVNAFAAGAGVGGPIGGVANAMGRNIEKENADLLNPHGEYDPDEDPDEDPNEDPNEDPPDGGGPQGELFPDLIGSYEKSSLNSEQELTTERDSLLEERDRLMRAQGGIYAEAADMMNRDTSLQDYTVEEVVAMMAEQEGRFGQMDTTLGQIDPALREIDDRLSRPEFADLPPRGLPQAQRLASQPTLFDQAPTDMGARLSGIREGRAAEAPISPGPTLATDAQARANEFSQELDAPEVAPNTLAQRVGYTPTTEAELHISAQDRADEFSQELTARATQIAQHQADQQSNLRFSRAEQQQAAQQAEQDEANYQQAVAQTDPQGVLNIPAVDIPTPQGMDMFNPTAEILPAPVDVSGPREVRGERVEDRQFPDPNQQELFPHLYGDPTIMRPHKIEDGPQAGETVMYPAPVREVLDEAQGRIDAIEELIVCRVG